MPTTKSISQLTSATDIENSTLFEVATPDDGSATGYKSEKVSAGQFADHIANDVNFPTLETTAKTLVGAINEAAQGGGGGSVDFTSTWRVVGKWIDGRDIYQKTYSFDISDMDAATIDATVIKGRFLTDIDTYDLMWIDFGNSFLMNTSYQYSPEKGHPLLFVVLGTSHANSLYTRTSLQRLDNVNDGKPFIYFENTFQNTTFYDLRNDLKWFYTIRVVKPTQS